jgi:uncharacterized protein with HEPN domain
VSFKQDPAECLADILENITRIERYVAGLNSDTFAEDHRTHDAVERCLERICEAVFRLGSRTGELMPGQPSAAIRGMGNRLRHAYEGIDLNLIWDTVGSDLPSLKAAAELALRALRAGPPTSEANTQ